MDLRRLFDEGITAHEIAESLASFDDDQDRDGLLEFTRRNEFDVVGNRRDGVTVGYRQRDPGQPKNVPDLIHEFDEEAVIADGEPLQNAVNIVARHNRGFVTAFGQVSGIVTQGDLQKTPFRMWVFGLITLVEMNAVQVVDRAYEAETWIDSLSDSRRLALEKKMAKLKGQNAHLRRVDYLEFCDLRELLASSPSIRESLGMSKGQGLIWNSSQVAVKPAGVARTGPPRSDPRNAQLF